MIKKWLLITGAAINFSAVLTTYPFLGTWLFWLVLAINDSIGFILVAYWYKINKSKTMQGEGHE